MRGRFLFLITKGRRGSYALRETHSLWVELKESIAKTGEKAGSHYFQIGFPLPGTP